MTVPSALKLKPREIPLVTDATGIRTTKVVVVTLIPLTSKPLSAVVAQIKSQVTAQKLNTRQTPVVMAVAGIRTTQTHAAFMMMMTLLHLSAALVPKRILPPLKMTSLSLEPTALIFNSRQTPVMMDATGTMVTKIHVDFTMTMTSQPVNVVLVL